MTGVVGAAAPRIGWRRASVTAVPPMHEHVQQWAGEQEQERKRAKEMSAMLRSEEERGDEEKAHGGEHGSRER